MSAAATPILCADHDAAVFLCRSEEGITEYRFLDQCDFVPVALRDIVATYTEGVFQALKIADDLRDSGMIGHHKEVMEKVAHYRVQRAECLAKYCIAPETTPSTDKRRWDASSIASELCQKHHVVLDDWLPRSEADTLLALLQSMKASGELQPGEVTSGRKTQTRGDLMAWVSTAAGAQPKPLQNLLKSIDDLIGDLSRCAVLADELGGGKLLVRHEMQCTCYPGNGAKYVRHVDDALANRGRILTLICYANPSWRSADGGELRIHHRGGPRDVEPLHGRLVLFWSDSRCPHEVLPAYKERYAVSVWISDVDALSSAAAAERASKVRA